MGRLSEASFGGGYANQINYGRTYTYDLNGNMDKRYSLENANLHQGARLEWTWSSGNGNRPESWTQSRPPQSYNPILPPDTSENAYEAYAYDSVGNRTAVLDSQGDTLSVMRYNLLNLPEEYAAASGNTMRYVYSADGEKLFVQHIPAPGDTTGTEYAANYRIEDGTLTMIHTDAGYYTPVTPPSGTGDPSFMHIWYLKDHLGNNRVLADGNGNALKVHQFGPFGEQIAIQAGGALPPFPAGSTESPYKYGGKEWNTTTSTYDFEARQMAPAFHRFTSMDPLCEKYYSISPYAYCANNPVNLVDPEGKNPIVFGLISAGLDAGAQFGINMLKGDSLKEALMNIDFTSVGSSFLLGMNPENMVLKAVSYASLVVDAAVDISVGEGAKYVGSKDSDNNKAVEVAIIDFISDGGGEVLGKSLAKSVERGLANEASSSATATLSKEVKKEKQALARAAASPEVQFVEGQVASTVTSGTGQLIKESPIKEKNQPLQLQLSQGYIYNPSGCFVNFGR